MKGPLISKILAALFFVSASMSSVADSDHHGKGRFMAFFDTNGDDIVTTDEFRQAAAERFSKMDSDGSGMVSEEEFKQYLADKKQKRQESRFQEMDSSADGKISESEYLVYKQEKARSRFKYMDKNGDGVLTEDEMNEGRGFGKNHGKHGRGKIFARLDKNGDGQITQQESLTAWTEWFEKIDGNSDGMVTADEVRDYRMKNFGNGN